MVMRNMKGLTLVELMVVIAVVAILLTAFGISVEGWFERYKAESQIKELYVDLMNARARAIQQNRVHFVSLPAAQSRQYTIYEDTNPAPDGDEVLDVSDGQVLQKDTRYTIDCSDLGATQFRFAGDGTVSANGGIMVPSSEIPDAADYDCIALATTRINMGVWNAATSTCEEK